jgi:nucleotide-binding universal stress UspA family protein
MNHLFQRILCPVDFDDQCGASLDLARGIAELTRGRVCAFHVMSVEAENDRGWRTGAAVHLNRIVDERLRGKIDYEFVVRSGSPMHEVLNAAREFGSDLIVIPTHGRTGLGRLVLGSVAEQIIRESTIPVLTVRTEGRRIFSAIHDETRQSQARKAGASLVEPPSLGDQARYEFRIWEDDLLHLKDELGRVATFVQVDRDTETYLVSNATDGCNAKIRSGMLDIKVLTKIEGGLEQWKPLLKVSFPLDRSLLATHVFQYLALEPPLQLLRPRYSADDFLREVILTNHRIQAVDVSKERYRCELYGCQAEFDFVAINGSQRQTVALESAEPEAVLNAIEKLGIGGFTNTSYVREIKRLLGPSLA